MIAFACSACQAKLSVKDDLAGRKGKCPACSQPVVVPNLATVALGPGALPVPVAPPDEGETRTLMHTPSNDPQATQGIVPLSSDSDPSLTEFLSPPQAPDELGWLGKYRVLSILGHGGMGVVFKAEDPKLKRMVALKAMLPALARSASGGPRFLREAQAMAAVEHDHIVRIYQVDEERGVPFLAMELLKGEPLEDRLERGGKLPLPEAMRVGRQVAEALEAAHETGLIHRDVKPANVWLESPSGRVKILDFGLARGSTHDVGLTQEGAIIGTPAYMAPEQSRGEAVDYRCDLFSLGCVLYRMLTGLPPFRGEDTLSTLMAVAKHQPLPPARLGFPQDLSDLVMGLLEKTPDKRPASAGAVAAALRAMEGMPLVRETAGEGTVVPEAKSGAKPGRRRVLAMLAVGLIVLLALGAGLAVWLRS